jgi:SAM-dependent methyltransferase
VLTVDYDRLDVHPGTTLLDLGAGPGRHTFEALRRGASVVAVDLSDGDLRTTLQWSAAMAEVGEIGAGGRYAAVRGDVTRLPFPDASVDRVIASEVLEHVPDDDAAFAEIARVLRPGGLAVVTVPRWGPERVCWALSDAYHANDGGHVRIYRADELANRLSTNGFEVTGRAHEHALHAPFWWLKCAVGVDRDHPVVRAYHRLLVWDLTERPAVTRLVERALNPLIGKSVAIYLRRDADVSAAEPATARG